MPFRHTVALITACLLAAAAFLVVPGQAPARKDSPAGIQAPRDEPDWAEVVFTEVERRIIDEYYHARHGEPVQGKHKDKHKHKDKDKDKDKKKGLPPGLAKRDSLPPGLQKQLERKGHLPPGLEKKALPDELRRELPKARPGTRRYVVDRDVVLVQEATGIILDILEDVVTDGRTN